MAAACRGSMPFHVLQRYRQPVSMPCLHANKRAGIRTRLVLLPYTAGARVEAQKQAAAKKQPEAEPPDEADLAIDRDDGREVPR